MTTSLKEKSKIAVTGANGFIGAHCVFALLKSGFHVVAIVRDPNNTEKTGFLKEEATNLGKDSNLTFASGDLLKDGSYDDALEGCDGVLHTAAVVEIENVKDAETQIIQPSVQGTQNILNAIAKHASIIKRYVHISSIAAIQSLEKPDSHVFTEEDWNTWSTKESTDPYGYAKTTAEKLVWDTLSSKEDLDVVVLNPSIVLGPCYCKAHTKSSTVFIRQILYGNSMLNYNGSFVDVRDVAHASVLAFTNDKASGKRFIVNATTEPINTMDLNDITKKSCPWVKGATPKFSETTLSVLGTLSQVPFLQGFMGIVPTEFQMAMITRNIQFSNTQSKEVLGLLEYKSLEDTCQDSVSSMKPFIKISNWVGGEEDGNKDNAAAQQNKL